MRINYILFLLLLCLAACQDSSSISSIDAHSSADNEKQVAKKTVIAIKDYTDTLISLSVPAQRIVTLAPHLTELVYSVGAGDNIVATVSYSNYPEAAKSIPQLGSYKKINYEQLVAYKPDLVLAFGGNGHTMVNRMRELGLTVFVGEPRKLEDIAESLKNIGELSGHSEQANQLAQHYLTNIAELRRRYSQQKTVPVFYQVWNKPLLTINGEHLISDVIRLCGGKNIFSDAVTMAPKINVEAVIRRNPQVIVASGHGESRPEWLDDWLQWPAIDAVKNNQLFFIHPDLLQRHTLRILKGAKQMCDFLEESRLASGSP